MGNRRNNYLALLATTVTEDTASEAQKLVAKAVEEDQAMENLEGVVNMRIALGQILMEAGKLQEAKEQLDAVRKLISQVDSKQIDPLELEIIQQALSFNFGIWHKKSGDLVNATTMLRRSLACMPHCNMYITKQALLALQEIAEGTNNDTLIPETRKVLDQLFPGLGAKSIMFLLDYSGSMSGSRIKAAVSSMLMIFDEYTHENDEIACVTFAFKPETIFSFQTKSTAQRNQLAQLVNPSGGTAFYDAISSAINMFAKSSRKANQQWLVALTDGEDTNSRKTVDQVVSELKVSSVTGCCVVGLGNSLDTSSLNKLSGSTPQGMFVHARSTAELSAAFKKVGQMIEKEMIFEEF